MAGLGGCRKVRKNLDTTNLEGTLEEEADDFVVAEHYERLPTPRGDLELGCWDMKGSPLP